MGSAIDDLDDILGMQSAFFLRGFFPPPSSSAFVLMGGDGTGAAADAVADAGRMAGGGAVGAEAGEPGIAGSRADAGAVAALGPRRAGRPDP